MKYLILFLFFLVTSLGHASELTKIYPSGNKRLASRGSIVGVRLLKKVGDKKVKTRKFAEADMVQVIGQRKKQSTWFYCRIERDLIEAKGMTLKEFVNHLNGQATHLQCEEYEKGGFSADEFKLSVFGVNIENKTL